jgi:hypothetical protein
MDIRTQRLLKKFKESKLSQTEICEKTGITKGALSSYLKGRYFPKQQALDKLAEVLETTVDYLMGNNEEEFTPKFKILARNFEKLDEKNKNTILKMIEVMIEEEDDNPYSKEEK